MFSATLIIQFLTLVLAGGTVQLIVFLIKRKPELRKLDVDSDAIALTSANAFIVTLQATDTQLRTLIQTLETKIDDIGRARHDDRVIFTQSQEAAQQEIVRLGAKLAELRTDIMLLQSEIRERNERGLK